MFVIKRNQVVVTALAVMIAAAGEYIGLLLGIVFLGEGMFFFSALLLLGGL